MAPAIQTGVTSPSPKPQRGQENLAGRRPPQKQPQTTGPHPLDPLMPCCPFRSVTAQSWGRAPPHPCRRRRTRRPHAWTSGPNYKGWLLGDGGTRGGCRRRVGHDVRRLRHGWPLEASTTAPPLSRCSQRRASSARWTPTLRAGCWWLRGNEFLAKLLRRDGVLSATTTARRGDTRDRRQPPHWAGDH